MNIFLFGDLTSALTDLVAKFISAIPNIIGAIVIIFIGFIISKLVQKFVRKLLENIGIDKVGEKLNEIEVVEKTNIKVSFSKLFSKIIYYVIFLLFLVMGTEILGMPAVSQIVTDIINFIPNVIVALIIIIVGTIFADAFKGIVKTTCDSLGIPSSALIANFVFYFILINVIIVALSQAKIDTAFLSQNLSIIIAGVVLAFAIGYGLASKSVIGNYLGSIQASNKIQVGDIIQVGADKGEIIEIDKSTVTIDSNDRQIIYPLKQITEDKITIFNN